MDEVAFAIRYKDLVPRTDWAAEKAAPFLHPKLSAVTATVLDPAHEAFIKECEAIAHEALAAKAKKKRGK